VEEFYSQYPPEQSWKNVISIGDGSFEVQSTREFQEKNVVKLEAVVDSSDS